MDGTVDPYMKNVRLCLTFSVVSTVVLSYTCVVMRWCFIFWFAVVCQSMNTVNIDFDLIHVYMILTNIPVAVAYAYSNCQ